MTRSQRARSRGAVALVGLGLVSALGFLAVGGTGMVEIALALFVLGLMAATGVWLARPGGGRPHWEAQQRLVREGAPIVYWRPGCPACWGWRAGLGRLRDRASWVDIWEDEAAAAFVRDVNNGVERVPTVILPDGQADLRPKLATLRRHLAKSSGRAHGC